MGGSRQYLPFFCSTDINECAFRYLPVNDHGPYDDPEQAWSEARDIDSGSMVGPRIAIIEDDKLVAVGIGGEKFNDYTDEENVDEIAEQLGYGLGCASRRGQVYELEELRRLVAYLVEMSRDHQYLWDSYTHDGKKLTHGSENPPCWTPGFDLEANDVIDPIAVTRQRWSKVDGNQ